MNKYYASKSNSSPSPLSPSAAQQQASDSKSQNQQKQQPQQQPGSQPNTESQVEQSDSKINQTNSQELAQPNQVQP